MAVVRTKQKKELMIDYDGGVVDGKQKIITKRYTNIVSNVSDERIYAASVAICGLQTNNLVKVNVRDTDLLTED